MGAARAWLIVIIAVARGAVGAARNELFIIILISICVRCVWGGSRRRGAPLRRKSSQIVVNPLKPFRVIKSDDPAGPLQQVFFCSDLLPFAEICSLFLKFAPFC